MLYFFSTEGDISVILCLRNASQLLKLLGKKPKDKDTFITPSTTQCIYAAHSFKRQLYSSTFKFLPIARRSNLFPCSGGMAYL